MHVVQCILRFSYKHVLMFFLKLFLCMLAGLFNTFLFYFIFFLPHLSLGPLYKRVTFGIDPDMVNRAFGRTLYIHRHKSDSSSYA